MYHATAFEIVLPNTAAKFLLLSHHIHQNATTNLHTTFGYSVRVVFYEDLLLHWVGL